MSNERDSRPFDKRDSNRQERIKNKSVTLPEGIDINRLYRIIEGRSDLTSENRIAFLCFYLYSVGVGLHIICGYLHLTPDTVKMYVDRMQQADPESPIGKLRVIYDELGLPASNRPLTQPTRPSSSSSVTKPTTRVGGSVKQSANRAIAMGRFKRIDPDQPLLKPTDDERS